MTASRIATLYIPLALAFHTGSGIDRVYTLLSIGSIYTRYTHTTHFHTHKAQGKTTLNHLLFRQVNKARIYHRYAPFPLKSHKLNRSKLNRSPLLSFLTMPNLKYLSSPFAVLPPTYHFSPKSLNPPSELVSLPLLALLKPPLGGDIACGLLDVGGCGGGDLAAEGDVEV